MPTGYNHHTLPMEKVLQAQAKSFLAKSRNQDGDPCPNLPEIIMSQIILEQIQLVPANKKQTYETAGCDEQIFILFSIGYYCTYKKLSQTDHKKLSFLFWGTYCMDTFYTPYNAVHVSK